MQVSLSPQNGPASPSPVPPRSRVRKVAAFSLVEVTLAMGIVGFAVVSVFGTMSVGLNTIQDAGVDVTNAQIISQLSSTVLQTPFADLKSTDPQNPLFFDQVGRQLENASNALYSANLVVNSGGITTYPGATTGLDSSAKSVQINISLAVGAQNRLPTSRTMLLVPRS